MHSLWARVSALFFWSVTVLLVAAAGSSVTTLWLAPGTPRVHRVRLSAVSSLRAVRETRFSKDAVDRAFTHVDVDADLSGVWNWNVKQLYVFVAAEYTTADGGRSEAILWDDVLRNASASRVRVVNAHNDYPLFGKGADLRGATVTLSLGWDVMPITGVLARGGARASRVRFPAQYCAAADCVVEHVESLLAGAPGGGGAGGAGGGGAGEGGAGAGAGTSDGGGRSASSAASSGS